MGTFIMLAITISMIFTYTRSLFRTKAEAMNAQTELIAALDSVESQGVQRDALKMGAVLTGIFMSLFYIVFFISSAVILNNSVATIIGALFSVLSIRSFMIAIDFIKNEKLKPINNLYKVGTLAGLLYTLYFLIYYLTMKFNITEIIYLGIGMAFGGAAIYAIKTVRSKKVV